MGHNHNLRVLVLKNLHFEEMQSNKKLNYTAFFADYRKTTPINSDLIFILSLGVKICPYGTFCKFFVLKKLGQTKIQIAQMFTKITKQIKEGRIC